MARLARTCVLLLVTAAGATAACGHLPFDELPETDDSLSVRDASTTKDGNSIDDDGGGLGDGGRDGALVRDARAEDAGDDDREGGLDGSLEGGTVCDDCTIFHVSIGAGFSDGDGSRAKPFQSIKTAIAAVIDKNKSYEIHVAGGKYDEQLQVSTANLSIFGSYRCASQADCDWTAAPDLSTYPTLIEPTSGSGATVVFQSPADKTTVLRNVHVVGHKVKDVPPTTVTDATAVSVSGAAPVLEGVFLEGGLITSTLGNEQGRRSIGLLVANTPPGQQVVVRRDPSTVASRVQGRDSTAQSVGVLLAAGARVTIEEATIRSSFAPASYGVLATGSTKESLLDGCTIRSGLAESFSWGVKVDLAGLTMRRNRINYDSVTAQNHCAAAGSQCGGVIGVNASLDVQANLIGGLPTANSFAIFLTTNNGGVTSSIINGNYLVARGVSSVGATSAAIALGFGASATASPGGKIRNNILRGGTNPKRYGILEVGKPANPARLQAVTNNYFANDMDAQYGFSTGSNTLAYDENNIDLTGVLVAKENMRGDDPGINDATGRLLPTSACIGGGATAEDDPDRFGPDIEGQDRTVPIGGEFDIGPDERE